MMDMTDGENQIGAVTPEAETRLSGLSFFFPAHNEEANAGPLIDEALQQLPRVAERFEIICVDDGSTDGTADVVRQKAAADVRVRLVSHETNRGYGAALRTGFGACQMPWVFFTDGDRQFRLDDLQALVSSIQTSSDAVVGYRIRRRDMVHRKLNAALYRMLIRLSLGLKVRDIDCAYKLIPAKLLEGMNLKSDGALISAELLLRLQRAGAHLREVGVNHYPRMAGESSGARISVILRMFTELLRLAASLRAESSAAAVSVKEPLL